MASSVSLPLVVWHGLSNPDITCTTYSHSTIYAGQKDGHIWVYNLKNNSTLEHKLLLIGHKKAVVALCITQIETDTSLNADVLISAAEDGEIIRWNATDGRCQAVNPNGFFGIPRALKVFPQIMAIYNNEFIPQFIVPSDPETNWEGGGFFAEDRVILWTVNGDIFDYRLQESAVDSKKYRYCKLFH
ncbi:hypothetical protein G6F56_008152 [Rhizopus delemar]|nr:hypothetical protein G6F56_008152 [Rhizopus delemar]